MANIITTRYHSPAGELILGSLNDKLCLCDWATDIQHRQQIDRALLRNTGAKYVSAMTGVIQCATAQLDEYFAGARKAFDIPLAIIGTGFQRAVRQELLNIPYGTTITYADLAQRIGSPKAIRAVAAANASNPLSIFLPCHRVIGSNNSLIGYGGGLAAKEFLIKMERANC